MKKKCLLLVFLNFIFSPIFADFKYYEIPDSLKIRQNAEKEWFYADLSELRNKPFQNVENDFGQKFQIRMEENDESYFIIVCPVKKRKIDFYTEKGIETREVEEYSSDMEGSWVLKKNSKTQTFEELSVYFSANSSQFIKFTPQYLNSKQTEKVLADFMIYPFYVAKDVPVGIEFKNLLTMSFTEIYYLTQKILPWKYADTQQGQFSSKLKMLNVLRKNSGKFAYLENSCFDENGVLVNITDGKKKEFTDEEKISFKDKIVLDDAGFLKWVIDGFIQPITGSRLFREPLLVKTVEYQKIGKQSALDKKIDLSFTLDWCRNLSAAHFSVRTGRNYLWNEVATDVNIEPFSAMEKNGQTLRTSSYIKDSGYKIEQLNAILYILAATEPSYAYLASIKRPFNNENGEYFSFTNCALIIPFFDENGIFTCTVFEGGKEYSLKDFVSSLPDSFVNLSRFLVLEQFFPE